MTKELKPCPFCGTDIEFDGAYIIHPDGDCILAEYEFTDCTQTEDQFVAAWNRRA
jgi:hypothetical protein